ncbi:UNVERIFIED_CONTAM: hypothetical protein K2H54_030036 [Gekko kuhli]
MYFFISFGGIECLLLEQKMDFTCQKCKLVRFMEENTQSLQERTTTLQEIKKGRILLTRACKLYKNMKKKVKEKKEESISLLSLLSVPQYKPKDID